MMYSLAERVFILEYYFASKLSAAVCKGFNNAYPLKELDLPIKTTIHLLASIFWDAESVCEGERFCRRMVLISYISVL
jgi:hypothetical protein